MLSGSSTSAAFRLQPADPDCVPRPSPSRTSQVALGGPYRHIMCGPTRVVLATNPAATAFGHLLFPDARTGRQYPYCQYPWLTGRQCPIMIAQRSVSRHPSQFPVAHRPSVPSTHRRLTGRQCPKRLVSRHPSQLPVAHRQSLVTPCSDDGLAAVPASTTSVLASGPRNPASESRGPSCDCPSSPASGRLRPGRARARPSAPPGLPGADPDPGPRLRHRGYEHWPTKAAGKWVPADQ